MPTPNAPPQSCTFSLSRCLPSNFFTDRSPHSATDAFTYLTFAEPECGDCLIMALINASGQRGLSAILPTEDQLFKPEERERAMWEREEPILPLVPDWTEGNFSLGAVVRPGQDRWNGETKENGDGMVKLRDYCVKLLSRYIYSLAQSPTQFALSHNPGDLSRSLYDFDHIPNLALGCLNDDQPDLPGIESAHASVNILGAWMEKRFGHWQATWEKQYWPWTSLSSQPSPSDPSITDKTGDRFSQADSAVPPDTGDHQRKQEGVLDLSKALEALNHVVFHNQSLPVFSGGPGQG